MTDFLGDVFDYLRYKAFRKVCVCPGCKGRRDAYGLTGTSFAFKVRRDLP